ncbi:ankyrin repeats (many copies) domain-containing protein [Ditylenchus destructor]|uniref:Ankyrin repeats (Many copies) domain-containing protein n=1 Tax=Ditylenchus destructor TaxID=166010 RepID=A0AAD4MZ63_9BILA|nr:ankyrin repeats (many copies) domain-containing protein [Ditylenchus destructor]
MVTALHFAAFKGHTEAVKLLLSRGANLEAKDFRHLTALHLAARNGHKELLKYLLDSGAEVNGKVNYLNDLPGVSPKATAMDFAEHLDPEIVVMLKNHGGVKSDTESTFKRYFLIYAIGLTVIIAFGLWFVRSKLKWCKT